MTNAEWIGSLKTETDKELFIVAKRGPNKPVCWGKGVAARLACDFFMHKKVASHAELATTW